MLGWGFPSELEAYMTDPNAKLSNYQRAAAKLFPQKVEEALRLIGDSSLELLALRRYVRKAGQLDAQWVWDHQHIREYEVGPQAMRVQGEIAKVTRKFEEINRGYTLGTSPIRDLARQVRIWKRTHSVHAAAAFLRSKCLQEISAPAYPDVPGVGDTQRFRGFLRHCAVHPEPTAAAPGLSDHGQMHAIDFVIMQGKKKIADTDSASIPTRWVIPGWDKKLASAIKMSGSMFQGPLLHPPEPWHYWLPH
jgi:hypothetical protein